MKAIIKKIKLNFPGDNYFLDKLISNENIDFYSIKAIISKTTGSGELNDYSRHFAELRFINYLSKKYGISEEKVASQIVFITSSGSEGIVTPHAHIIYTSKNDDINIIRNQEYSNNKNIINRNKGFVVGVAKSPKILTEEIGTEKQVSIVAKTTQEAILDSGIKNVENISVVFVKSPVIAMENNSDKTHCNPRESISLTRAASALGVGVALGEIQESAINPGIIGKNMDIFSKKAFTFSGSEINNCQVVLLGNSINGNQDFVIESVNFKDMMDVEGINNILKSYSLDDIISVFAKIPTDSIDFLRGNKIPVYYNQLNVGSMMRAVGSGLLVPIFKNTEIFISGGGEHQGPKGSGFLVSIFKKKIVERSN